jgi:hypothetical protein
MKTTIIQSVLCVIASSVALPAMAADTVAKFDGGIGVQPLRAGALPNDVFGILPGGRPWVISTLRAEVKDDNRISVKGEGLLLAGGNGVATTGGQQVSATLICDGMFSQTQLVDLDVNGNFEINDTLVPHVPIPCVDPKLLIRNPQGSWFAAGILVNRPKKSRD